MTLNIDFIREIAFGAVRERYDEQRTILYALGAGAGADTDDLKYIYEQNLVALPTMSTVLASTEGRWFIDPRARVPISSVIHREQALEVYNALPPTGEVIGRTRIDNIVDRGPGKSAVVEQSRTLHNAANGEHIATVRQVLVIKGGGGFGGSDAGDGGSASLLDSPADLICILPTAKVQAAIYRLSGDRNPLHIDPDAARRGGFCRPVLHGLCTYAFAGRAVIGSLCKNRPEALKKLRARFVAPVYPGDTLRTEIWRTGVGCAHFFVRVVEDNRVVVDNGIVEYQTVANS
jgi:acyl dehydratase